MIQSVWAKSKHFRMCCLHCFWKSKIVALKKKKNPWKFFPEWNITFWCSSLLLFHLVLSCVFNQSLLLFLSKSMYPYLIIQGLFWWSVLAMVKVRGNKPQVFSSKFRKCCLGSHIFGELHVGNCLHNGLYSFFTVRGAKQALCSHKVTWLKLPHFCPLLQGLWTGRNLWLVQLHGK